jgi:hypothetical protein
MNKNEREASMSMLRALVGDREGWRERSIMDAPNATIYSTPDYPGCVKVRTAHADGTAKFFVVRLSDGVIVN